MYLGIERRRPQVHGVSQEHLKMQGRIRLLELTETPRSLEDNLLDMTRSSAEFASA